MGDGFLPYGLCLKNRETWKLRKFQTGEME